MDSLIKDLRTEELKRGLENLLQQFYKDNQYSLADKVLDLIDKWEKQQVMIGFAGHFSAGKSTMINRLLKQEILPSSPIPTSANVVRLHAGEPFIRVYHRNRSTVHYEGEWDTDTIKRLCKDGEDILSMDISQPATELPDNVILLDTPGVDSTNDADRIITESSLHVMDHLFYVMDYNHVQSEVNLTFLQEMQNKGIPFTIIINQIDKHQDQELSFDGFKSSIMQALETWNIHPEDIFYTSLMNKQVSGNEFDQLQSYLKKRFHQSEDVRKQSIFQRAQMVLAEAVDHYTVEKQNEISELESRMSAYSFDTSSNVDEAEQALAYWEDYSSNARDKFEDRVLSLFKNAYLMPSKLRDDAEHFLQSQQPGFKVGLLLSKKKTEEERRLRKQTFYDHLMEVVEKNLKWPLRDRMLELLEAYPVESETITKKIQSLDVDYPSERLEQLVESGAGMTGQYVLVYTEKLAQDIKQSYKSHVLGLWEEIKAELEAIASAQSQSHSKITKDFEQHQEIKEAIDRKEEEIETYRLLLWEALTLKVHVDVMKSSMRALEERNESVDSGLITEVHNSTDEAISEVQSRETTHQTGEAGTNPEEMVQHIDRIHQLLDESDAFRSLLAQLEMKKNRLENRTYTVALFGAFSAGKSSFANAVMGDRLLPVSPNPTTAAINQIAPVDEENSHGTVTVQFKSEQQLIDDFTDIIATFDWNVNDTVTLIDKLMGMSQENKQQLPHKQVAFVEAVIAGYEEAKGYLGSETQIPFEMFASYVAEEKRSCFVESMKVHYDCPITRKGITLVDTPGADSVNARHTDVSFEYIKNADAILFITYYNHPFSKADQSFLRQLGRVKDVFSLDKMFFLINAADLAQSDEELNQVQNYIRDQLLAFDIRNPRIYPVSSLEALKARVDGQHVRISEMEKFEEEFYNFIDNELSEVLIASITHDINRVDALLENFIADAELDEGARAEKLTLYKENKQTMRKHIDAVNEAKYEKNVQQKLEKQVFYIHQRMLLNFNDFFKQHINPATINENGKAGKEQLESASAGLMKELNDELNQELRAVLLRMQSFFNETLDQLQKEVLRQLKQVDDSFEMDHIDAIALDLELDKQRFSLEKQAEQKVLNHFKNTKRFFEGSDREAMKEEYKQVVDPLLKNQLEAAHHTLSDLHHEEWITHVPQIKEKWTVDVDDYYDTLLNQLESITDIDEWKTIQHQLKEIVASVNSGYRTDK
ncbi:dynamin family protein [Thalassobacillus hwangdonensis]